MEKKETTCQDIAKQIELEYKQKGVDMVNANIQRRVYDALNIFCALGMIKKIQRSSIKAIGGPFVDDNPLYSPQHPAPMAPSTQNQPEPNRNA